MTDLNSLVPVVANAAVAVSENMTNLIVKAKASGIVHRTQLKMLKAQTEKVLADARAYHSADIVILNLEQIARTQERIDCLEKQGLLHGKSLAMAMDQLYDLNEVLRRILHNFENGELW